MSWISVKDRLPEGGATVDIWIVGKGEEKRYPGALCVRLAGGMYFVASKFAEPFCSYGFEVTHWMYPPAPPEEGKHV